jgi:membrane-bound inhibitor of C-type lysozyme
MLPRLLLFVFPLFSLALVGCAINSTPQKGALAATAGAANSTAETDQSRRYIYACDNGETVPVRYIGTDQAKVAYQGATLPMHIAISADGARYVGAHHEWWTRGAKATLFKHNPDGSTGDSITPCHEK